MPVPVAVPVLTHVYLRSQVIESAAAKLVQLEGEDFNTEMISAMQARKCLQKTKRTLSRGGTQWRNSDAAAELAKHYRDAYFIDSHMQAHALPLLSVLCCAAAVSGCCELLVCLSVR